MSVIATDGTTSAAGIVATDRTSPEVAAPNTQAESMQLHPNPFSGSATVSFTLTEAGRYSLDLYDSKGQRLSVLQQGWAEAGVPKTVSVDGSALPAGLYLISLQTTKGKQVVKLLKN
jgi:hypothetical protein